MNIPPYWARAQESAVDRGGKRYQAIVCRWSHDSLENARRHAVDAARQLAERLSCGDAPRGRYAYGDRPMREEIVEAIQYDGAIEAVITRNSYGSLVLNTARVAFIDIDEPRPKPGSGVKRLLHKIFGGSPPVTPGDVVQQRIDDWSLRTRQYSGRIYRTSAGFRCAITNQLMDPQSQDAKAVFADLEADPLYRRLCEVQQCFRARLTPKFWRCGANRPPNRFPWDTTAEEQTYRLWQSEYEKQCVKFATCKLVASFGGEGMLPLANHILRVHDQLTRVDTDLKLA